MSSLQPDYTADEEPALREAYLRIRKPAWGPFEAEMADPLNSRVIRYTAWRVANQPTPAADAAQTSARRAEVLPPFHAGLFDRKRAAAGDRDES